LDHRKAVISPKLNAGLCKVMQSPKKALYYRFILFFLLFM